MQNSYINRLSRKVRGDLPAPHLDCDDFKTVTTSGVHKNFSTFEEACKEAVLDISVYRVSYQTETGRTRILICD